MSGRDSKTSNLDISKMKRFNSTQNHGPLGDVEVTIYMGRGFDKQLPSSERARLVSKAHGAFSEVTEAIVTQTRDPKAQTITDGQTFDAEYSDSFGDIRVETTFHNPEQGAIRLDFGAAAPAYVLGKMQNLAVTQYSGLDLAVDPLTQLLIDNARQISSAINRSEESQQEHGLRELSYAGTGEQSRRPGSVR